LAGTVIHIQYTVFGSEIRKSDCMVMSWISGLLALAVTHYILTAAHLTTPEGMEARVDLVCSRDSILNWPVHMSVLYMRRDDQLTSLQTEALLLLYLFVLQVYVSPTQVAYYHIMKKDSAQNSKKSA